MKHGAPLLIAAVIVGGGCTHDSRSSADTVVVRTASAGTIPSRSANSTDATDGAALCVYTDPGRRPISVHRALSCPDGTQVSVRGIVIGAGGGRVLLCDQGPGSHDCLTIERGVMPNVAGGPPGTPTDYTGTVSKGVLSVGAAPPVLAGNVPSVVVSPLSRPSTPLHSA
jgi:hypothetical protein